MTTAFSASVRIPYPRREPYLARRDHSPPILEWRSRVSDIPDAVAPDKNARPLFQSLLFSSPARERHNFRERTSSSLSLAEPSRTMRFPRTQRAALRERECRRGAARRGKSRRARAVHANNMFLCESLSRLAISRDIKSNLGARARAPSVFPAAQSFSRTHAR